MHHSLKVVPSPVISELLQQSSMIFHSLGQGHTSAHNFKMSCVRSSSNSTPVHQMREGQGKTDSLLVIIHIGERYTVNN